MPRSIHTQGHSLDNVGTCCHTDCIDCSCIAAVAVAVAAAVAAAVAVVAVAVAAAAAAAAAVAVVAEKLVSVQTEETAFFASLDSAVAVLFWCQLE